MTMRTLIKKIKLVDASHYPEFAIITKDDYSIQIENPGAIKDLFFRFFDLSKDGYLICRLNKTYNSTYKDIIPKKPLEYMPKWVLCSGFYDEETFVKVVALIYDVDEEVGRLLLPVYKLTFPIEVMDKTILMFVYDLFDQSDSICPLLFLLLDDSDEYEYQNEEYDLLDIEIRTSVRMNMLRRIKERYGTIIEYVCYLTKRYGKGPDLWVGFLCDLEKLLQKMVP